MLGLDGEAEKELSYELHSMEDRSTGRGIPFRIFADEFVRYIKDKS